MAKTFPCAMQAIPGAQTLMQVVPNDPYNVTNDPHRSLRLSTADFLNESLFVTDLP